MQLVLDLNGGREFRPREGRRPPRYFFALLPDAEAKSRIEGLAHDLHKQLHPARPLREPDQYHVTLRGIAAPDGPFGQSVAMARRVVGAIRKTSFAVMFNQAASFGAAPNYAFSLTTWADLLAANSLSNTLLDDLRHAGLKVDGSSFQPHVTVFYDKVRRTPIDMPAVSWHVREFVLIESIDNRKYVILDSWPLD